MQVLVHDVLQQLGWAAQASEVQTSQLAGSAAPVVQMEWSHAAPAQSPRPQTSKT